VSRFVDLHVYGIELITLCLLTIDFVVKSGRIVQFYQYKIYLINHVSAERLTAGWMILSGTNSRPAEVSRFVDLHVYGIELITLCLLTIDFVVKSGRILSKHEESIQ
jgi:hypothetical protein